MFRSVALVILLFLTRSLADAAVVRVAAASDLNFAIKEIISGFEQATGHTVQLSLGSSGTFYAQISNGAPFEVFLSADAIYPERLASSGKVEQGTMFVYAIGRIVIWVPNGSR